MLRGFSFLLCLLSCLITRAQQVSPLFECTRNLDNPYGFCAHVTRKGSRYDYQTMNKQLCLIRKAGANNIRSDIDYGIISKDGNGILDSVLLSTRQYGINFLGIAYNPQLYRTVWQNTTEFSTYLNTLKDNYAKRLQYVEFCNEVNYSKLPNLTAHYIFDLQKVYDLKKQNPNLKILFSGVYDKAGFFLDSMMSQGAYRYFDVMNLHIYPSDEDQLMDLFKSLKENMNKYHWSSPVWITETGMNTAAYDISDTNYEFFTNVVPQALKKLRLNIKKINYGIIHDTRTGYTTLNDDEVMAYITGLGASPVYLTFDEIKNIGIKRMPVLVATYDEGFPAKYFPIILDYVKRGGTIILPYGAPFYYDRNEESTKGVGDTYAKQLHIGELFWWTNIAKALNAPETPVIVRVNALFGKNYTYGFDKKTGKTARYLTEDNLKGKDKMIPITYAGNDQFMGVVAAIYKLNSDLKGNIIIQTRLRTQRYVDKESEQARRIARFYLTSFAYGIDKVFWYKFRSCELDSTYSEDNFGVVHKDLSPKPAYYAYKTLTTMCPSGSTRPTLNIDGDIYTSTWTKPDGAKVSAIWSPNGTCYKNLNISGVKLYDYLGNAIKQNSKNSFLVSSGVTYSVLEK